MVAKTRSEEFLESLRIVAGEAGKSLQDASLSREERVNAMWAMRAAVEDLVSHSYILDTGEEAKKKNSS